MNLELALKLTTDNGDLTAGMRSARGELDAAKKSANDLNNAARSAGEGLNEGSRGAGRFADQVRGLRSTGKSLASSLTSIGRTAQTSVARGLASAGSSAANLLGRARSLLPTSRSLGTALLNLGRTAGTTVVRGLRQAGASAREYVRQTRQAQASSRGLATSLSSLGRIAGIATGLLGGITLATLAADMAQTIHQTELLRASLLSAVGGAQALADQGFAALEAFAARTPFALEQSVEAFIKMRNLGIRPTEERMTAFGNTAAAMGRGLNQMIEAVADAATGEFERLKEFGIKARQNGDQVSLTFQGVTTTIKNNSEAIVGYLTNIGKVQFGDAMANQMARIPGLWSNLKDNIDGIWRDLGDAGATTMFASWLSAGVQWTQSMRNVIRAGWFDWMRAELGVSLALVSSYWEVASQAVDGYVQVATQRLQTLLAVITGESSLEAASGSLFESVGNILGFIGNAIGELPVNLRTIAAIAIGESEKLRVGAVEQFELMVNSGRLAWENLSQSMTTVLLGIELQVAETIESIIQRFGQMVSRLGATLAGINNTSVGDALVPDDLLASIQQAGAEMSNYAAISEGVRSQIDATNAAHQTRVSALEAERAGIEAAADTQREAADQFIQDALEQRDQSLALRDARIQEARAAADTARASFEANRVRKIEAVTIDDVTDKLNDNSAAQEYGREALDRLLDSLDPVRVAQRDYREGIEELENALRAGAISQEEFNTAVGALEAKTAKAVAASRRGVDALETAWKRGIERIDDTAANWLKNFLRTGEVTFDAFKDLFLDMLAEMVVAAARNQIVLNITSSGTSSLVGTAASGLVSGAGSGPAGSVGTAGTGAAASGAFSGASLTTLGVAGLAVYGITEQLNDVEAGKYDYGDIFSGNWFDKGGYKDNFDDILPGLGSYFLEPLVDAIHGNPFGILDDVVGDLFGSQNNGDNKAQATFAGGDFTASGIGNSFNQANLDAVQQLGDIVKNFEQALGGSDFAGQITIGNRSGLRFTEEGQDRPQDFTSADEFLQYALRDIISDAPDLTDTVRETLLNRDVDASTLSRDTGDAQLLEQFLADGRSVFDEVDSFASTFEILADTFRREGETFVDVLGSIETGMALLDAAGSPVERTIDGLLRAQSLVDQVGLETAQSLVSIVEAMGDGVRAQFNAIDEDTRRTSSDIFETLVQHNRERIAAYDGTTASSQALAQATVARRSAELSLLQEIQAATNSILGRIGAFREELILGGLDEEGQYNRFRDQITDLASQIGTAGSASQVDQLSKDIDSLARSAFGVLDENQQDDTRDDFLAWLDEIEAAATERLGALEQDVVDTSEAVDTETQQAIWSQAGLAGENLQLAATDLSTSAGDHASAAQAHTAAAARLDAAAGRIETAVSSALRASRQVASEYVP